MNLQVGDIVECICSRGEDHSFPIVKGGKYRIKSITYWSGFKSCPSGYILLLEGSCYDLQYPEDNFKLFQTSYSYEEGKKGHACPPLQRDPNIVAVTTSVSTPTAVSWKFKIRDCVICDLDLPGDSLTKGKTYTVTGASLNFIEVRNDVGMFVISNVSNFTLASNQSSAGPQPQLNSQRVPPPSFGPPPGLNSPVARQVALEAQMPRIPAGCNHTWKQYVGFTDTFDYCIICDERKK